MSYDGYRRWGGSLLPSACSGSFHSHVESLHNNPVPEAHQPTVGFLQMATWIIIIITILITAPQPIAVPMPIGVEVLLGYITTIRGTMNVVMI